MTDIGSSSSADMDADLRNAGFLGKLALFVRGTVIGFQRPTWTFATLFFDYMVLSGAWTVQSNILLNLLWIVNLLVLSVLFGERAVLNIMPLVITMFQARAGAQPPANGAAQ